MGIIDLHSHTVLSDGELIPTELFHRAFDKGYEAIVVTDHMDTALMPRVIAEVREAVEAWNRCRHDPLIAVNGIEVTHLPPEMIADAVAEARRLGATIIVVHGESPVEPVVKGTNRAGILAGADVLAHPGIITDEDVKLAAERGVLLEITARAGHNIGNGRVAALARKYGAKLVIDSDTHKPGDLLTPERRLQVGLGAGLSEAEVLETEANARALLVRKLDPALLKAFHR